MRKTSKISESSENSEILINRVWDTNLKYSTNSLKIIDKHKKMA